MSTSSGFPHPSKAPADANEANKGSGGHYDVEQGDLVIEENRFSPNSQQELGSFSNGNLADEPDEYIRLLKFIDIEAKKEIRGRDRDGADGEQETRRLWYMPWKKVPMESTRTRKVPQSWLYTDMSQGLSETEVTERRARFGYNELERYATRCLQCSPTTYPAICSPRANPIVQFVGYFRGPILFGVLCFCGQPFGTSHVVPTVMELAVLLSAGLRDWIDFGVIVCPLHTRPLSCLTHLCRSEFLCLMLSLVGIKRNRPEISLNNLRLGLL